MLVEGDKRRMWRPLIPIRGTLSTECSQVHPAERVTRLASALILCHRVDESRRSDESRQCALFGEGADNCDRTLHEGDLPERPGATRPG